MYILLRNFLLSHLLAQKNKKSLNDEYNINMNKYLVTALKLRGDAGRWSTPFLKIF